MINSLILHENQSELPEIIELWKRLGVWGYLNFIEQDLSNSLGMKNRKARYDVIEERRRELAQNLLRLKQAGAPILNPERYFELAGDEFQYKCHFPKMVLEVYSDGMVLDCVQVDKPLGNIRDTPLEELLKHPRIQGMMEDGEERCCVHRSVDRVGLSYAWEHNAGMVLPSLKMLYQQKR